MKSLGTEIRINSLTRREVTKTQITDGADLSARLI